MCVCGLPAGAVWRPADGSGGPRDMGQWARGKGGAWGRPERRDRRCARGVAMSSPAWPGRPYPVRPVESAPGAQTPPPLLQYIPERAPLPDRPPLQFGAGVPWSPYPCNAKCNGPSVGGLRRRVSTGHGQLPCEGRTPSRHITPPPLPWGAVCVRTQQRKAKGPFIRDAGACGSHARPCPSAMAPCSRRVWDRPFSWCGMSSPTDARPIVCGRVRNEGGGGHVALSSAHRTGVPLLRRGPPGHPEGAFRALCPGVHAILLRFGCDWGPGPYLSRRHAAPLFPARPNGPGPCVKRPAVRSSVPLTPLYTKTHGAQGHPLLQGTKGQASPAKTCLRGIDLEHHPFK